MLYQKLSKKPKTTNSKTIKFNKTRILPKQMLPAKIYNRLYKQEQQEKLQIIKKLVKPKKSDLLLDIGCGTGLSTKPFIKKCKCIGIDPSKEMLKYNKFKTIKAKAENLPFKNSTFDIIISVTSLHLTDLKKALKEIKRVAKPNAKIIISFLKKSKQFHLAKKFLKNFKKIEHQKDTIFYKK